MWELLALTTGKELGQFALTQILAFTQPVLESYVQDFFKGCLDGGIARLKATQLKVPMAAAIGFFIQRFVKELQFNDIPDSSIQHHYQGALKTFVRDKAVGAILGQAFETGCKKIDFAQLETIWQQKALGKGWQFPEDFDWRGVAKEYLVEVKGIVKADAELRALLQTDLLQEIAQNTTQLSPGFDVAKYQDSLQCSYGYLKLYTLDSTDRVDAIKLWNLFVEQTVREALPPMRYELPLDLKRKLLAEGQLEEDLSAEALEHYRRDYFQQPTRKVLDAVADCQRAVILGDPGSGKSTLLQYLALDWVEGKTSALPLLIELREYALAQSANFLDFLHCGRGADWQFDQQQLHQHLLEQPTLVMFDGLDEVFHRPTQAAVIDEIIRFAQQYPQAQILVTSRIVGYTPERFQHAEFKQFTIQPLDEAEIHTFIERWYDLAMGSDGDKGRLKQRLKDAIANSKAIQNLADNPLLLTMMAILNRRQELPRDRVRLYEKASEVLLYQWDVEEKLLKDPRLEKYPIEIDQRDKQRMLRRVAAVMQTSEKGLAGNFIRREALERCLTDYLKTTKEAANAPSIATVIIDQLRERNFILCFLGGDAYGFVHRTFLEYFCATEIEERFNKRGTPGGLSFEELRDEVFARHWQDESWHEVLRLLAGTIDAQFAGDLIQWLMAQSLDPVDFLDEANRLQKAGLANLLLAADCLGEVRERTAIAAIDNQILRKLQQIAETEYPYWFSNETATALINTITLHWQNRHLIRKWLESCLDVEGISYVPIAAIRALARSWKDVPDNLLWLKSLAHNSGLEVRQTAIQEIARGWKYDPNTLSWLKALVQPNEDSWIRQTAIEEIVRGWRHDPNTLSWLKALVRPNEDRRIFQTAIEEIARGWRHDPNTLSWLKALAQSSDEDILFRYAAISGIVLGWKYDPNTLSWLKTLAQSSDEDILFRYVVMREISQGWKYDSETLPLLQTLVQSNEAADIRSAVVKLARNLKDDSDTLSWLKTCALSDENEIVRRTAVQEIAQGWKDDLNTLSWLKACAQHDENETVRRTVVQEIAQGWEDDLNTLSWLKTCAQHDENETVRRTAVQEIAQGWKDDLNTLSWLKACAQHDESRFVRFTAVKGIAQSWKDDPSILLWLRDLSLSRGNRAFLSMELAQVERNGDVSRIVVEALSRNWKNTPNTVLWLKVLALSKGNGTIRQTAVDELVHGWQKNPDDSLRLKALTSSDQNWKTVRTAINALAQGWGNNSDTLFFFKALAKSKGVGFIRRTIAQILHTDRDQIFTLNVNQDVRGSRNLNRRSKKFEPNKQLRKWAQEQLKIQTEKLKREGQP